MEVEKIKKCHGCKKELDLEVFKDEEKDKYYSRCHDCRDKTKKRRKLCELCGIRASFNYKGEKTPIYCKEHCKPGMICILSKNCIYENCNMYPSFNYEGEKPLYCKKHSLSNMVDVVHRTCIYQDCKRRPNSKFRDNNGNILYCSKHSPKNNIKKTNNMCIIDECFVRASYNFSIENKPLYCAKHALENMCNISDKKCIFEGCKIRPSFNYINIKTPIYCKTHSLDNMVTVTTPKCKFENCSKNASFNIDNKDPIYCKEHASSDMKCVRLERCKNEKCNKSASYNFSNDVKPLYCSEHKLDNMVDIRSQKCTSNNCKSRPSFGYCGQTKILCAKHRNESPDMNILYFKPKRKCVGNDIDDCKEIATYGTNEPTHCEDHKLENEIYLIAQKCKNCNRNDLLNKDSLCITYCSPNEIYQQNKREKIKEKITLNYLDKYVFNLVVISDDKIIPNNCNIKVRPDRIYDCGTHWIIIEIDENQHKSYKCHKGEISRMHEIQNAAGIPCIFLRFNPDNYKVNDKLQNINLNQRLKLLVKWIEKCKEMIPENDIEPVKYKYLFYDDFEETDLSFKILDDIEINKL